MLIGGREGVGVTLMWKIYLQVRTKKGGWVLEMVP